MSLNNNMNDIEKVLEIKGGKTGFPGWRRWALLIVLVAVGAAAAWFFLGGEKRTEGARYKTDLVRRGELTVRVTATGTLEPTNSVEVGSELSGIVKSVEADYNSRVKAGQVLARLDTAKLETSITQARASLESARAKLQLSEATVLETKAKLAQLRRVREISEGRLASQLDLDAAEAAFARADADAASSRASVSQAKAVLAANETDLAKAIIRSPINGIVLVRSVEPGQTVAASFTAPVLFKLAEDLTSMELHVDVDEADIGTIREGLKASFAVAAYPNRTFAARITQARYGATTTSGVVTYETVLKVHNDDLSLRPGMTATADIIVRELKDALLIPGAALRFTPPAEQEDTSSRGIVASIMPRPPKQTSRRPEDESEKKSQRVWILKDGAPVAVPVTTGLASGSFTEVASGALKPGDQVVVDILAEEK
jgi:HlyD family secretion protein